MLNLPQIESTLRRQRCFQRRLAGTANTTADQYEVFSHHGYQVTSTMKQALNLAHQQAHQHPGVPVSIWSPLRCHVYRAVMTDNQYRVLHGDVTQDRKPACAARKQNR